MAAWLHDEAFVQPIWPLVPIDTVFIYVVMCDGEYTRDIAVHKHMEITTRACKKATGRSYRAQGHDTPYQTRSRRVFQRITAVVR